MAWAQWGHISNTCIGNILVEMKPNWNRSAVDNKKRLTIVEHAFIYSIGFCLVVSNGYNEIRKFIYGRCLCRYPNPIQFSFLLQNHHFRLQRYFWATKHIEIRYSIEKTGRIHNFGCLKNDDFQKNAGCPSCALVSIICLKIDPAKIEDDNVDENVGYRCVEWVIPLPNKWLRFQVWMKQTAYIGEDGGTKNKIWIPTVKTIIRYTIYIFGYRQIADSNPFIYLHFFLLDLLLLLPFSSSVYLVFARQTISDNESVNMNT